MSAPWEVVKLWFARVVDLPEDQRAVVLERDCEDAEVRAEVLALLAAEERGGERLEPSAAYRRSLGGTLEPFEDEVGRVVGPYRIDQPLGRGGMGTVWLAHREDDAYRKQVAVKLIKRGLDTDEIVGRFQRERQVLASLEHPGIARLIDGGATEDGRPFMVLEYVEGQTIDKWCADQQLSTRARLELFRKVCEAVQAAHRSLVVHRDLKPSNILITEQGSPKLLDFGIAKLLRSDEPAITRTLDGGPGFMTPEFASPEQVQGRAVTTSTDVYSLGVVLYQLLTGRLPYRFTTRIRSEIERAICVDAPLRPSTAVAGEGGHRPATRRLSRELSGDLDTIVLKALRKEPERRYGSVDQLSEDIQRHLDGLPVTAQPDTLGYRASKFVRRHRLAASTAVLVFTGMTAALLVITDLWSAARDSRELSDSRLDDLRELTGELIFDLHDEIARLPGATIARHRLIETGLRHLDGIAADAGSDPELLQELAAGYTRLGDVQGRPTAASLGDSTAALASHRKARDILAGLLDASPDDPGLWVRHGLAIDRIGTFELRLGRVELALVSFEQALEVLQAQGNAGNQALALYHRAEALAALGRTADALAAAEQCLLVARPWAAERDEDAAAQRTLETVLFKLADLHSSTRDFTKAEQAITEAIAIAERLVAADPDSALAERDLALALALQARFRIDDRRPEEAADLVERQLQLFEKLSAADPANLLAQRDLSLAFERQGALFAAQQNLEQALASYRRCVEIDRLVVAADPDNLEWQLNLATTNDMLCGVALALGLQAEALAAAQAMVALLTPVVEAGAADAGTHRTLALGHVRLGQLLLEQQSFDPARAQFLHAREAFAALAADDPEHAWTRRMEMVAEYFVGWAHREAGHDGALDREVRIAHLDSASSFFARSLELQAELEGLGMLTPDDAAQAIETRKEIAACVALSAELEAGGG